MSDINWPEVRKHMDHLDWEECTFDPDQEARWAFLGTVFSLYPSGKYYTPYACSNVTPEEAEADAEWLEQQEQEAVKYGLTIESGEGDPCDLFAAEYRDVQDPKAPLA